MSFLPIAILAYALNGGAVVIDKILLNTSLPKPAIYTFYISLLGLFTLLLLPFGFQWQFAVLPAALFSGVAGTLALLTFFQSLKMGQASVAGPLVGALNPLFALILGTLFFNQLISPSQFIAMLVLILGAGVLTFNVWFSKIDTFRQFLIMALAGFLFALSYVFLKEVFLQSNFVTGLVLTRLFGAGAALTFLFWPGFGKQIFASRIKKHTSLLLLAGQSMGAAQGFLLAAATALASPALVNSLFGVQYLVILWVALVLGKNHPRLLDENLSKKVVLQKIAGVAILSFGVYLLSVSSGAVLEKKVSLGVSFSPRYAQELGLDARATYQSILQELSTKSVRLSAYWNEIEPEQDQFNFDELDWYVSEASKNQSRVLLAIGYKLPRWPECRAPEWFSRDRQLIMLEKVIEHYENNPAVFAWQLENEPLLPYGLCPPPDREFLKKEVAFVKNLTKKPVIITDSGELRPWVTPARLSDILGITLYRNVETPIFGAFTYPFPPWFYRLKSNLVNKKTIIVELQAEPWSKQPLTQTPLDEQIKKFSPEQLAKNIEFARQTGFEEVYLWGVEWWYFMAKADHPEYLEFARELFK